MGAEDGVIRRRAVTVEAVLFDRDGTLIEDVPFNGDPDKVVVRPGAQAAVDAVRARRLWTGVVTNQSGVGRGLLTSDQVDLVNRRVDALLGTFDVWAVCPHATGEGCRCRKPAPGLVTEAAARLGIRPIDLVVVGDRLADLGAAHAAGAVAVLVPSVATEDGAPSAADHVISRLDELPGLLDALAG
jgi:histidinol-phosphate phosphatase family protein